MLLGNLHSTNRLRFKTTKAFAATRESVCPDAATDGSETPSSPATSFFPTCDGDGLILCFSQDPDRISDEVVSQHRQPVLWLICKLEHTD